jgi:hypothetical protein
VFGYRVLFCEVGFGRFDDGVEEFLFVQGEGACNCVQLDGIYFFEFYLLDGASAGGSTCEDSGESDVWILFV